MAVAIAIAACSACSSDAGSDSRLPAETKRWEPTALAPLADAPTSVERVLTPAKPQQDPKQGPNPALLVSLPDYRARGFGVLEVGPGEPHVRRVIDGTEPPASGPNAKRLLRFAELADLQIADDESPTRFGSFDTATSTQAALRPQDAYLCRMGNAAVRTINALHRKDPIALTLLGGDNADSAQTNELDWALGIFSGAGRVECDSGNDDDLVSGPDNDGKDPFVAEGLAMPWKWVTGNHDVLVSGVFAIEDTKRRAALGNTASSGTRNYAGAGTVRGALESGDFVVPDPKRALLSRQDMIAKIIADKDGHGLGDEQKASGRATYTFDVAGTPLRFLIIDSAHERGGAEGVIRQSEIDRVIKPALDKAKTEGKWVVTASHHATTSMSLDGGAFGAKEVDALSTEAWVTFLGQYDNVLFNMVGHSHVNQVRAVKPPGGHAFWEVVTASIADFPHQFRVCEIFDEDNGWIRMRTAAVDISVEGDAPAEEGRTLGVIDVTSGWNQTGAGKVDERNVDLWIKKP